MTWLDRFLKKTGRDEWLEALCAGLPEVDALDLRVERAAIFEFEAGMTRYDAERMAGLGERAA